MATKKTETVETVEAAAEATVTAKVLRPYIDRETKELHKRGTTVTLTKERYNELSAKGYVRKA